MKIMKSVQKHLNLEENKLITKNKLDINSFQENKKSRKNNNIKIRAKIQMYSPKKLAIFD